MLKSPYFAEIWRVRAFLIELFTKYRSQRQYNGSAAEMGKEKGKPTMSLPNKRMFWWGDTPTSPNLFRGATAARSVLKAYILIPLKIKRKPKDYPNQFRFRQRSRYSRLLQAVWLLRELPL